VEVCAECGFEYRLNEATTAGAAIVGGVLELASLVGDDRSDVRSRPEPGTWSPLEYACHVRDVLIVQRQRVLMGRREARPSFDPTGRDERVDHDGYSEQDPADVAVNCRTRPVCSPTSWPASARRTGIVRSYPTTRIVVVPAEADYWAPVNREVIVTLDDVLIEDGQMAPYNLAGPTFVAMGRFGNVMLTGGEKNLELDARIGEVVRFYLTNTANTRLFNVAVPGARMKLVGGDSGRYEHETFVDEVLLAASERAIVDVLFDARGLFSLGHRAPDHSYVLGAIVVSDELVEQSLIAEFEQLRTNPELVAERTRIDADRKRLPDKTLAFESQMPLFYGDPNATAAAWTCPMHPEVMSAEPGTCPSCGMKLGMTDDTIVVYSTDNDPHQNSWPDAGTTPFRSEKNTNWEGAFRVPELIRWPGKIPAAAVSNEIVQHDDWLPTFLAAAGDTNVVEDLKAGRTIGDRTFKVHIDGYNLLPYLTGEVDESPRNGMVYFSDDGDVLGMRFDNWKVLFMEQRVTGTLRLWAEPFIALRIPKLFNLRTDPFERADITSN
jgi:hypothetical protein